MEEDWQRDLERWLEPYLEDLGNKTRRRMCPAYIAGLIGPGDRKPDAIILHNEADDRRARVFAIASKHVTVMLPLFVATRSHRAPMA